MKLLVVIALAACSDLGSVVDGTCGNGVVEPANHEDCDRSDATCTATCRFACDPAADCSQPGAPGACCPAGFGCGANGECRAPSGTFVTAEITAPFDVLDYRVADLDGDHVADVLGVSTSTVSVRHGSPTTPLVDLETRQAPFATGAIAIGDYTGDGRPDVLIPVAGGLFAFETTTGTAEPVSFPAEVDTTHSLVHARVAAFVTTGQVREVRLDEHSATMTTDLVVEVVDRPDIPPTSQRPCGLAVSADRVRGRALHPFDDGGTGAHVLVPIVVATDDAGLTPPILCIDTIGGPGIQLAGGPGTRPAPAGEAFFVEGAGCPDLVAPVLAGAMAETIVVPHAGTAGACAVDVAHPVSLSIGLPLASITLTTGAVAVITSQGVYNLANPTACKPNPGGCLLTAATRPWGFAVTADFDRDGDEDFAVGGVDEDVEVFVQLPAAGGKPQWLDRRIATPGTALILAAGDFDGDSYGDIAIATVDPLADRTAQLAVAFGSATADFTAPIAGPTFAEFDGLATAPLVDSGLPLGLDHADDLIVAHGGETSDATLVDVYGSGSRILTAPWAYESTFGGNTSVRTSGWAAAIGRYGADRSPGAFAAFTQSPSGGTDVTHNGVVVQLTRTPDTFAPSADVPIDSCVGDGFCAATAHYLSIARPDADLLLGFGAANDSADCGAYYLASTGMPSLVPIACATLAPAASADELKSITGIASARVLDGDGTGTATIAVTKLPRDGKDSLWTWTVSVVNGLPVLANPLDLSKDVARVTGVETHCLDATAIELGSRDGFGDGKELVVACRVLGGAGFTTRLFARYASATADPALIVPLLDIGVDTFADLETGDVDGDGLDDLVFTAGTVGTGTIHVHTQCDIHTACAIGGGS